MQVIGIIIFINIIIIYLFKANQRDSWLDDLWANASLLS